MCLCRAALTSRRLHVTLTDYAAGMMQPAGTQLVARP